MGALPAEERGLELLPAGPGARKAHTGRWLSVSRGGGGGGRKWGLENVPQNDSQNSSCARSGREGQPGRFKDEGRDFVLRRKAERSWETCPPEGRGNASIGCEGSQGRGVNHPWDHQRSKRQWHPCATRLQRASEAVSASTSWWAGDPSPREGQQPGRVRAQRGVQAAETGWSPSSRTVTTARSSDKKSGQFTGQKAGR